MTNRPFTCVSQQLPGQSCRPLAGFHHCFEIFPHRTLGGKIVQHDAGVAHDAGKQVVEVVRDAARQHAQALQLLGLLQPVIKPPSLGNIAPENRQDHLWLDMRPLQTRYRKAGSALRNARNTPSSIAR